MFRRFSWQKIKRYFKIKLAREKKSSLYFALSAGFGVFMSITPIWGFQILAAIPLAHFLKLNKTIVTIGACFTLFPPIIPFVLYFSYRAGGWIVYNPNTLVSMDNISLEFVKTNFYQYLVGSIIVALICGSFVMLLVWLILTIRKGNLRSNSNQ